MPAEAGAANYDRLLGAGRRARGARACDPGLEVISVPDPYPVATTTSLSAWLEVEREQMRQAATPSGPRFQQMFEANEAELRAVWTRNQGTGSRFDGADLSELIEGQFEAWRRRCHAYERRRLRVEAVADELLEALRRDHAREPQPGHRPVTLASRSDDDNPYLALACLDCSWLWVWDEGDLDDTARRHRAAHLDPAAWGLCQRCAMPRVYFDADARELRRRDEGDPARATDMWPRPAVGLVHLWFRRNGPYPAKVCSDCHDQVPTDVGDDDFWGWNGDLLPPGQELVGNSFRDSVGPGVRHARLLHDQT